jgi:hypothetical protein
MGNGFVEAEIISIEEKPIEIETKGKIIKRNGSKKNPALLLKNKNGTYILKLKTEVRTEE